MMRNNGWHGPPGEMSSFARNTIAGLEVGQELIQRLRPARFGIGQAFLNRLNRLLPLSPERQGLFRGHLRGGMGAELLANKAVEFFEGSRLRRTHQEPRTTTTFPFERYHNPLGMSKSLPQQSFDPLVVFDGHGSALLAYGVALFACQFCSHA
jgi:hypothetical protein